MPNDVWTPMLTSNPSLRNKSLRARNKITHVELLRGLCRDMLWLWPVDTYNAGQKEIFCPQKKKSKAQTKQKCITTTCGKSLFLTQYRMRYTIYIPPNTKDLAINLRMVVYGNRQNAIRSHEQTTPICCEHWNILWKPGLNHTYIYYIKTASAVRTAVFPI